MVLLTVCAGTSIAADGYGNILSMQHSTLVASQTSVVADEIRAEGEECNRAADGTIGGAVKGAMTLHINIAKKAPDIEPLFQADCLTSLRQLWDISGAIGALGSLTWAAVRAAIMQAIQNYVQGRICQAVNQVAGMINGAIDDVNNQLRTIGSQFDYLNGMSTGLTHQALFNYSSLSSEVAADKPLIYAVQSNPYKGDAVHFENSSAANTMPMIPPPPAVVMPGKKASEKTQAPPAQEKKDDSLMSRMSRIFGQ